MTPLRPLIFITLSCFLAVSSTCGAFATLNEDTRFLQQGRDFNQARQWSAAVKSLDQAIAINPRLVEAYLERGAAFVELGKYPQAVADCSKCLKLDGHFYLPYVILGDCYGRMHHLPQSLENYSKYIEVLPESAQPYFERAKVYEQLGKADLAKSDRLRGARNEARSVQELKLLTTAYCISGPKLAVAKDAVIKKDPYNRFNTVRRMLIVGCTEHLKKAPLSRRWFLIRGRLYRDIRQFDQALADYSQVINIPPNRGGHVDWNLDQTLFDRGDIYMNVGDYGRACADFARIIAIDEDSEEAYAKKGDCEFELKKYDQAVADYNLAIKHQIYPTATLYYSRAKAYDKLGKKDLSEKDRQLARGMEKKS